MNWPLEDPKDLEAFYGPILLGQDGRPTAAWESEHLTRITPPYPLVLAWDPARQVKRVVCHRKVARSLKRALNATLALFGTYEGVVAARMHLYGGCYEYRRISGRAALSLHAYGAAIDFDPERNPLGRRYDGGASMLLRPVVDIFEAEGWTWGGTFRRRPDCMHFQAADLRGRG